MHHHHALALLLFSIVFAAFALFTLCTFAPKNHNPSNLSAAEMEDNALSSLSGLPIRRSLEFGRFDAPLIVRDGILLNERGYRGTLTLADEGHYLGKRSSDVSQLFQRIQEPRNADECSHCVSSSTNEDRTLLTLTPHLLYQPHSVTDSCRQVQQVRLTDPSIRYWVPFEQPLKVLQDGKSLMDRILTLLTFWKRSGPALPTPADCSILHQHDNLLSQDKDEPIFTKEYVEDASEGRVKAPTHVSWDEGALPLFVSTTDNVPQETPQDRLMVRNTNKSIVGNAFGNRKRELIGKQDSSINQILPQNTLGKQSNVLDSAEKRSINVSKDDSDLLAKRGTLADVLPTSLNLADKKMVVIDFQKAERDAQRAGLAPGFIIETEYPTQQRKVVQHLSQKPGSRVSNGVAVDSLEADQF